MANATLKALSNGTNFVLSLGGMPLLTVLRYIAVSFSLLNMLVLRNKKLKDPLYTFLLVMATVDSLYGIIITSLRWADCIKENQNECSPYLNLANMILYISMSEYLTSCMALFNILLEIFLTLQRIFLISNMQIGRNASVKKVCLTLAFISLVFYSPVLFIDKIVTTNGTDGSQGINFKRVRTEFGKTKYAMWTLIGLNSTRTLLVTVVLLIINIVAIVKFNAYLERKAQLTSKNIFFSIIYCVIKVIKNI
jgi:hypothetical protein